MKILSDLQKGIRTDGRRDKALYRNSFEVKKDPVINKDKLSIGAKSMIDKERDRQAKNIRRNQTNKYTDRITGKIKK